jgi:hypothetical protein
MTLCYVEDSSAAAVAALLRRQKKVSEVILCEQKAIPVLCRAIVQDCCQQVQKIGLYLGQRMTDEQSDLLAGALERDGAQH